MPQDYVTSEESLRNRPSRSPPLRANAARRGERLGASGGATQTHVRLREEGRGGSGARGWWEWNESGRGGGAREEGAAQWGGMAGILHGGGVCDP